MLEQKVEIIKPEDLKTVFKHYNRCYVSDDTDATEALNLLMEDIETVVEDNSRLKYYDAMNNSIY